MTNYHINVTDRCNLKCKHCYAVKKDSEITKECLDAAISFLKNRIELDKINGKESHINILGSEIGLYDCKKINWIMDQFKDMDVTFETSSNLCYNLDDERIEVYKRFNTFLASFDYEIRFSNEKERKLWFKNIKTLCSSGVNVSVTFTITNQLISNVTPQSLIDFMLALPINTFCFQILSTPIQGANDRYNECLPMCKEMDNWLFQLYLLYEKYSDVIKIRYFEEAKDRFKGIPCGQFGHNCMQNTITIMTSGDVATCPTVGKPFYNVLTKELHEEVFNELVEKEKKFKPQCLECEVFDYCRGSCFLECWDETGCTGPKKVFMYLKEKLNE